MGCGGICDTVYTLTWFATEFIDLHKDTNWEELHFSSDGKEQANPSDTFLYRSEKYKKLGKHVSCLDEAAEDYAEWRIENFNYEDFAKINHNKHANNPLISGL